MPHSATILCTHKCCCRQGSLDIKFFGLPLSNVSRALINAALTATHCAAYPGPRALGDHIIIGTFLQSGDNRDHSLIISTNNASRVLRYFWSIVSKNKCHIGAVIFSITREAGEGAVLWACARRCMARSVNFHRNAAEEALDAGRLALNVSPEKTTRRHINFKCSCIRYDSCRQWHFRPATSVFPTVAN